MTTHAIYNYMSPAPQSIGRDQPLCVAHKMMREHHLRHLPVLDGGVLQMAVTHVRQAAIVGVDGALLGVLADVEGLRLLAATKR